MIAVAEGMDVEAASGTHIAERRHGSASARTKSSLVVSFTLLVSPANTLTGWPAHSASAASSVKSSRPAAAARRCDFDDDIIGERLRRLHRAQAAAVERFADQSGSSICLDRIGDGDGRHGGAVRLAASMARVISAPLRNGRAAS